VARYLAKNHINESVTENDCYSNRAAHFRTRETSARKFQRNRRPPKVFSSLSSRTVCLTETSDTGTRSRRRASETVGTRRSVVVRDRKLLFAGTVIARVVLEKTAAWSRRRNNRPRFNKSRIFRPFFNRPVYNRLLAAHYRSRADQVPSKC